MVSDWRPIFVLPNIPITNAIGTGIAAVVPFHDGRIEFSEASSANVS